MRAGGPHIRPRTDVAADAGHGRVDGRRRRGQRRGAEAADEPAEGGAGDPTAPTVPTTSPMPTPAAHNAESGSAFHDGPAGAHADRGARGGLGGGGASSMAPIDRLERGATSPTEDAPRGT